MFMKNQKREHIHIRISTQDKLGMAVEAEKLGLTLSAFIGYLYRFYVHSPNKPIILNNLKEIAPGFYSQELSADAKP